MIFLAAPGGAASATPVKMAINLAYDLAVAFLLYDLVRPVSRRLSLLAALFSLIFVIVMVVTSLKNVRPQRIVPAASFGGGLRRRPRHRTSAFRNELYSDRISRLSINFFAPCTRHARGGGWWRIPYFLVARAWLSFIRLVDRGSCCCGRSISDLVAPGGAMTGKAFTRTYSLAGRPARESRLQTGVSFS